MNLSRPARTRLGRALVRAPIWLYRYQGLARPFPPAESGRRLAGYAHRHPHAGASLLRASARTSTGRTPPTSG